MHKAKGIILISLIFVISSCSYNVPTEITPATSIYSSYEGKIPGKFILVNDSSLRNIHKNISPSTFQCSAHSYPLSINRSLVTSIYRTSKMTFKNIVQKDTTVDYKQMQDKNIDGQIFVRLKDLSPKLRFEPGFWTSTAIAKVNMILEVKVVDENGDTLLYTTVGSNSQKSGSGGGACEEGASVLANALESTERRVMEKYAQKLANSDSIRDSLNI